jgi:hypothetical protein
MSSTSLDDLLDHGEEPEPQRQPDQVRLWWWGVRAVLLAAAAALVIWSFARVAGFDVPFALLFMLFLTGRIVRALLRWIEFRPLPATLVRPSDELISEDLAEAPERDGLALATSRWESRLSWVRLQSDKGQFARTVQPRIVEMVDERLRLRHGVLRSADPARARAILGEQLWAFVSAPISKNPSPRDLAGLITLMERI